MASTLVWFRRDLRLQDNPALRAAATHGGAIIPVYIHDVAAEGNWPAGAPSRWWLHHSLLALEAALRERGSRLILARGDSMTEIRRLVAATGAGAVAWNRRIEPAGGAQDAAIRGDLQQHGLAVEICNAGLLHEPESIVNRQGGPYQVFTPYWRACLALKVGAPIRLAAGSIPAPSRWPRSLGLDELRLLSSWAPAPNSGWETGEAAAARRLRAFSTHSIERYAEERDLPAADATSRLSAHLHFGEIGPRQIWAAVRALGRAEGVFPPHRGAAVFLAELGWREFAHHLLHHFPDTPERPLRAGFADFPWEADSGGRRLRAWQQGATGYPIVDAGMRQLARTGWMHNRVRMIVASFLVKHLRLPWSEGAAWFWARLVDADLANNTLGWQWSAGCGADATPYFRIFAPVLQGRKFDPDGAYVRRWVPELAELPAAFVHSPWEAEPAVLAAAGVRLDKDYPRPIVDHAVARAEALAAYRRFISKGK